MPDRPALDDRLKRALVASADLIGVDADPTAVVAARARARRRRRRVLVGSGATLAVAAALGVLVVATGDRDELIETAEPPTATEPDADAPAPAPTTTTEPPAEVAATVPPVDAGDAGDGTAAAAVAVGPSEVNQLFPWRDGFLSVGYRDEERPLGPVPDEIAELFPQEVRDLFADGLPPTIEEATEVLSEAGLLDEVSAVLADHPEASDAIFGTAPPDPPLEAAFTTDGESWTTTTLTGPVPYASFTVAGDRLVAWGLEGQDGDAARVVVVASTTDLETWSTPSRIEIPVPPAPDEYTRSDAWVSSLAVSGDRWVATADRHTWVDIEALLPADVREQLQSSMSSGFNTTPEGVDVEFETESGERTELSFTWAELGLDGNPEMQSGPPDTLLLGGDLAGNAELLTEPDGLEWASVASLGDGFVLFGNEVLGSPDGITWSRLDLPADTYVSSVVPVPGGDLLLGDGPEGATGWLRSADGVVTAIELPELPHPYGLWNQGASAAWMVQLDDGAHEMEPYTLTIERDSYVFRWTQGARTSSYELLDADGAVVRSGDVGLGPEPPEFVEIDEATGRADVVFRADDGSELLRIPSDELEAAIRQAFEEINEPAVEEEWNPDVWLLATDGERWLVRDLPDPAPNDEGFVEYYPEVAAVNGDMVLYRSPDGWVAERLPAR